MSIYKKLAIAIGVLLAALFAYYLFSIYLVSRLDGTGGVHASQQTMMPYASEDGVSFMYPDSYKLTSGHHTVGSFSWDSLELVDKSYVPPVDGEGPTAIS